MRFKLPGHYSQLISTLLLMVALPTPVALAVDFQPPRTMGLGGAGRAGALLNDSIYLNPSYIGFQKSYSISGNYQWYKGDAHGTNFNVSVLDGTSEYFSAGVAYTVREDLKQISVGLGRAVVPNLAVGVGANFLIPKADLANQLDVSVSASWGVTPWLTVAAIGQNLIADDAARQFGQVREISLGSKLTLERIFMVYFDPHWAPSLSEGEIGYNLGLEFALFSDFSLKLGNFKNASVPWLASRGEGYSTGLGWVAPRISFDFAISRVLDPIHTTTYSGGLTVFF